MLIRLQDVPAGLVAYPYVSSYIKEINEYRSSRNNINITFSTLQRRLALDPWLPLVTTVTPSTVSGMQLLWCCSTSA
jgi:hypothetical protein